MRVKSSPCRAIPAGLPGKLKEAIDVLDAPLRGHFSRKLSSKLGYTADEATRTLCKPRYDTMLREKAQQQHRPQPCASGGDGILALSLSTAHEAASPMSTSTDSMSHLYATVTAGGQAAPYSSNPSAGGVNVYYGLSPNNGCLSGYETSSPKYFSPLSPETISKLAQKRPHDAAGNPVYTMDDLRLARLFVEKCIVFAGHASRHVPTQKELQRTGMTTTKQQKAREFLKAIGAAVVTTRTVLAPHFDTLEDLRAFLYSIGPDAHAVSYFSLGHSAMQTVPSKII